VFLSNGPGDPAATGDYAVPMIEGILETDLPVFGICLGHQMLALALGAKTVKMNHGHHGANHPVKDLETGKVEITSMNHGFTVDSQTLPEGVIETHVSLFDGSNCGIRMTDRPVFSVQYHPEASPGPQDSFYLFERFATEASQARVPEIESCRTWARSHKQRLAIVVAGLSTLLCLTLVFPHVMLVMLFGWAAFTLVVSAIFKTTAFIARQAGGPVTPVPPKQGDKAPLPRVSVLVPLFRETEIAHALVARLTQLTYPKCLLDVVLVLEEEDDLTRRTLAQIDLPSWIRVVVVPDGRPRTKPRAMNYALDFCEGDIIGIFDAEDAPEPDQITRVARHFQQAARDVVCLQGILDYYNPRQNWLARCFTIEYASWFRTILPGMARLGFAIPLGGTTLYFRRDALEALGGWDAHNVTEDADLGFRLARHGFRTEMVATVTEEEANCRPWAWVKQRSRWLKGYMTTYLVHMRRPGLLYRQLGAWKFLGFQAHFVSALSQVLLAPLLWSFWLVFFGLPHPLDPVLPRAALVAFGALFLAVEALNLTIYLGSVAGPKHRHLLAWVPTMHFYLPLGAIAAYKALYELVLKPFFWDKTKHGLSLGVAPPPAAVRGSDEGIELP
jgi:cellulose synthase/poly-beta-1,6-N-acetylglucosamine synthase-like glycosyltransferase/anthranilate/para-aminobenzoate synthase component II